MSTASKRKSRNLRTQQGLCYDCGIPCKGSSRCSSCAEKHREKQRIYHECKRAAVVGFKLEPTERIAKMLALSAKLDRLRRIA